jgi:hypothetical protein
MKPKPVKYFTTHYTWQMIACSVVYAGVNMAMYDLVYDGTVLGMVIIVIIQSMLLNSIINYGIFGIERIGEIPKKITLYAVLVLGNTALLLAAGESSVWSHCTAGFVLAAWLGRKLRRINGDNRLTAEDTIQAGEHFEHYHLSANFPVDMGRKYRKNGILQQIGKAAGGKYAGQIVALVKYDGELYIGPYRYITVAGSDDEVQLVEDCRRKLLSGGN